MEPTIFICAPARLDGLNSGSFSAFATNVVTSGARRVILDLTDLTYMSSAGVRIVMMAHKQLNGDGGKLVIYGCRPHIRDLLNMSGLSEIAPFAETFEAAKLHARAEG